MSNNTTDLYTVVKNTAGKPLFFGFLGARGVILAPDATFSIPGDLVTSLANRARSVRKLRALEYALTNNLLEIVKSPSVYLLSESGGVTKELAMSQNGTLGTTTPSWAGGSAFAPTAGPTGATGATGATGPTGPSGG
jgi:hypothetical protein